MSGILMAIKLLDSGNTNFVIYEKADKIGGTWRDNTYPGLQCDVPAHMFTFSFESNPRYSNRFPKGHEIQEYLLRVCEKYDLLKYIQFQTSVESVSYENGYWFAQSQSGMIEQFDSVVCATGVLHHPRLPKIEGIHSFDGPSFHTARWDHSVSLQGKRVGVIGTGSTAVQIVPKLAAQVGHLTLFQRTPQWIFPMPNKCYSDFEKDRLQKSPWLAKRLRWIYSKLFQWTFSRAVIGNPVMLFLIQRLCRLHLERRVKDSLLREKLTPKFKAGCKRLVFGTGFYQALQYGNVSLETDPIGRIDGQGVLCESGKHIPCDLLIYATGFQAHNYMRPMKVTGVENLTLDEAWRDGAYSHRSTMIPGFPNFFMIFGPYSPIGNYSAMSVAEVQVEYILKALDLLAKTDNDIIAPKPSATRNLLEKLDCRIKKTVWASGCQSWYLDKHGKATMWPWTFERYTREMSCIRPQEFILAQRNEKTAPKLPKTHLFRFKSTMADSEIESTKDRKTQTPVESAVN